ncbi:hypothetical protein H4R18_003634 [Coemansia javaensis]|uniref:Small integral membrane protein 8 n=1 Tax=Coemansia javaensis TaxID=2761396 RepID=A0A9W8H7A1_9FUNG|nr:hypothetical protein H4R18_003634 [Coemansia javaensis]
MAPGSSSPEEHAAHNAARKQHDVPATRLFKVLNPELHIKPNRMVMYAGAAAMAGVVIWLGSGELRRRRADQAAAATTLDRARGLAPADAQQPQTYQERMAELKRTRYNNT